MIRRVAVGTQDDGPKEKNMDTQRNDIGDRAAPVDAPESIPAPDPSIPQVGGGVEQPGAAGQGRSFAVSQFSPCEGRR